MVTSRNSAQLGDDQQHFGLENESNNQIQEPQVIKRSSIQLHYQEEWHLSPHLPRIVMNLPLM